FSMPQIAHLIISFMIHKNILYSMMLCTTRNIMNLCMQQPRNFVVGCSYHSPPIAIAHVLGVVPFIDPSL
ncbi:hypothetical protein EV702DRAFT_1086500, partial [Suillus placidus]